MRAAPHHPVGRIKRSADPTSRRVPVVKTFAAIPTRLPCASRNPQFFPSSSRRLENRGPILAHVLDPDTGSPPFSNWRGGRYGSPIRSPDFGSEIMWEAGRARVSLGLLRHCHLFCILTSKLPPVANLGLPWRTKLRHDSRRKMIDQIEIHGFKSAIDPIHLKLRPLTIIAGENSSGKSSIMQPVLLLKQSLETPYDPGDIHIAGPNVQFTRADQLFSRTLGDQSREIQIKFKDKNNASYSFFYARSETGPILLNRAEMQAGNSVYTLKQGMQSEVLYEQFKSLVSKERILKVFGTDEHKLLVKRDRCFLEVWSESRYGQINVMYFADGPPLGSSEIRSYLQGLIHVPGLRGNPDRVYQKSAVPEYFPGLFNDYVASIMHNWKEKKDPRLKSVGKYLEKLGLGWKVDTRQVDDTKVEVLISRLPKGSRGGARDLVSIADVGFGVSQTLPVVVSLLAAKEGQTVYVEQPEIHLHPMAQIALAEIICDAVKKGVNVLAETHSNLLLLGIQILLAKRKIEASEVGLNWFARRPADGATVIDYADVDDLGRFGSWPVNFNEVELKAHDEYMSIIEKRLL